MSTGVAYAKKNQQTSSSRYKLGQHTEKQVAKYLSVLGHKILFCNLRTVFAEIDLITLSPQNQLIIWEIKSVTNVGRPVIGYKQEKRLRRVFQHLLASANMSLRAHVAAVNHKNEIILYLDFLSLKE